MAGTLDDVGAARYLVATIVGTAIWSGEMCTWMGREPRETWVYGPPVYASLGPDLYGGTAGVALALAWAARVLGDRSAAKTAVGAIQHALHAGARLDGPFSGGLYSGTPGLSLAATAVGVLLQEREILEAAHALRNTPLTVSDCPDLVLGNAGALLATTLLASRTAAERQDLLESLTESASPKGGWKNRYVRSRRPLTGLSHGASGEAFALLETYATFGEERAWAPAIAALQYEARAFDVGAENWPDFRTLPDAGYEQRAFGSSWCHGAPGIGLVHAYALTRFGVGSESLVKSAARTTTRIVDMAVSHGRSGSLCHGLAGNAEILREIAAFADPERVHDTLDHAAQAVRAHVADAGDEDTPALMVGRAGLLYFFLRRLEPEIPSILLPEARNWLFVTGNGSREVVGAAALRTTDAREVAQELADGRSKQVPGASRGPRGGPTRGSN